MVAYFSMLKALILMFSIFSLMVIPVLSIYTSYNGLESGINYSKTKYSLGNMGFSEHICKHVFVETPGKFKFDCRTGTIASVTHSGILPYDEETKYGDYMGFCGDQAKYPEVNSCKDVID